MPSAHLAAARFVLGSGSVVSIRPEPAVLVRTGEDGIAVLRPVSEPGSGLGIELLAEQVLDHCLTHGVLLDGGESPPRFQLHERLGESRRSVRDVDRKPVGLFSIFEDRALVAGALFGFQDDPVIFPASQGHQALEVQTHGTVVVRHQDRELPALEEALEGSFGQGKFGELLHSEVLFVELREASLPFIQVLREGRRSLVLLLLPRFLGGLGRS